MSKKAMIASNAYKAVKAMKAMKAMQAKKKDTEATTRRTYYRTSWLGLRYVWTVIKAVHHNGWVEVTWSGQAR